MGALALNKLLGKTVVALVEAGLVVEELRYEVLLVDSVSLVSLADMVLAVGVLFNRVFAMLADTVLAITV